jgi:hypothetical protein
MQDGLLKSLAERGLSLACPGPENDLDVEALKRMRDPEAFLGLVILGEVAVGRVGVSWTGAAVGEFRSGPTVFG